MFIVILKFSDNKEQASEFMESHNEWIKRGFDDGVCFCWLVVFSPAWVVELWLTIPH